MTALATLAPDSPSQCFSWCDHDGRFPGLHTGARVSLSYPHGRNIPAGPVMSAVTCFDEDDLVGARVSITVGPVDGVVLDSDGAEDFADRLIALASQIRQQARSARQAVAA